MGNHAIEIYISKFTWGKINYGLCRRINFVAAMLYKCSGAESKYQYQNNYDMKKLNVYNRKYFFSIFLCIGLIVCSISFTINFIVNFSHVELFLKIYTFLFAFIFILITTKQINRLFVKYHSLIFSNNTMAVKIGLFSRRYTIEEIRNFKIINSDDNSFLNQMTIQSFREKAIEMNNFYPNFFNTNYKWRLYFHKNGKQKRILNGIDKNEAIKIYDFLNEILEIKTKEQIEIEDAKNKSIANINNKKANSKRNSEETDLVEL